MLKGKRTTKKLITTLMFTCLVGVLGLMGCSEERASVDYEVSKVVFVRISGDVDKTDVYVFEPDLSLRHQVVTPAPSLLDMGKFPVSAESALDEEQSTISETGWQSIVNILKRTEFMTLPEEVATSEPATDFPTYYIYVETTEGTHLAGGYAAGMGADEQNRRFGSVLEYVKSAIDESSPVD